VAASWQRSKPRENCHYARFSVLRKWLSIEIKCPPSGDAYVHLLLLLPLFLILLFLALLPARLLSAPNGTSADASPRDLFRRAASRRSSPALDQRNAINHR